ncbi:MAG TPA: tetratricopeptide repeat protein [Spirochaetia bacterium]|nr:tetratricopeptide repeat protein [Spirochaetia bacterium]
MRRLTVLLLLLLCAAGAQAALVERIRVEAPLVDPATQEAKGRVADLIDTLAGVTNRLYADRIEIARQEAGGTFEYSLSLIASLRSESPSMVIRVKRLSDGKESAAYPWLGQPTPELPSLFAHAVFLLWGSVKEAWQASSQPPQVIDELPAALISQYAYPWSLAAGPGGDVLAALGTGCVELDHSLRVVAEPGKSLGDGGVVSYALGVSVTPGGTVLLKPAQGSNLYRIDPDAAAPRKVQTGIELATAPFAALPDGGVLVVDSAGRKAVKITGKKRLDFPLFANPTEYIGFVGVGPDSTVWVYDSVLRAFRIYSVEGKLVDYVLPLVDPARQLTPLAMTIGPDGSFIVLSPGQLLKFSRDGSLVWKLESLAGLDVEKLPASGSLVADWNHGLVYLADTMGRRIVRLLDTAYCTRKGIRNAMEEKLVALRQSPNADEAPTLSEIAGLYETAGSSLMARASWQRVLDADPGNQTAQTRLRALEVADLKRVAADLDRKARETLEAVGPESARLSYMQAVQTYEQILSRSPGDREARASMEQLKKIFETGGPTPEQQAPLVVQDVKISSLFPALMQFYLAHPAGTVTVSNPLSTAVQNVRVSAFIPRFMDFPSESKVLPRLDPAAQASLDIVLKLQPSVLDLQEDTVVQVRIDATCSVNGIEKTTSRVVSATMNRNTALTWDDTRKIAAYITPNEETVSGFARRVLDIGDSARTMQISRRIFHAMHICDALGAYGMSYVPNPETPISKVLGNSQVIDTVHFPRATLANRGGDCSDTTALLASLFESVGIRTAVLTTPGHIFLAFDTGEPGENAPLFSTQSLEVILHGSVWIPVETTVLRQGFLEAWIAASELVRKYRAGGPFEFLPLAEMRGSWPALPLPPSAVTIVDPSPAAVQKLYSSSLAGFTAALYTSRISQMTAQLAGQSGRQASLLRIRVGILHGMFGDMTDAEAAFRAVMASDPSLVSPYINVANIRLLAGDTDGALALVNKGLAVNPKSPLLNLLAARIYGGRGDATRAADFLARVKATAPDFAARYADSIATGTAASQRAADQGDKLAVTWGNEQ